MADFDNVDHSENDATADSVGDRRQEIVLIGPGLGDSTLQSEICDNLDKCLLSDSEWELYKVARGNEKQLEATFPSPLISRTVTY